MQFEHILVAKVGLSDAKIPSSDNCFCWRDVLSVGPVPASKTLSALSRVREAFWSSPTPLRRFAEIERSDWLKKASDERRARAESLTSSHPFLARDQHFEKLSLAHSVVWCGRNTAEVLMLAAIWNFSNGTRAGDGFPAVARLSNRGARASGPDELRGAFEERIVCDPLAASYLAKLWTAYTASEPGLLGTLPEPPSEATLAHWCHQIVPEILSEYPSIDSGLSKTEILLREAASRRSAVWIVAETLGKAGPAAGDALLYETLWNFTMGEAPLLEAIGGKVPVECFRLPKLDSPADCAGSRSSAWRKHYVVHGNVDRWVGGVHFKGSGTPRRLDRRTMKTVKV